MKILYFDCFSGASGDMILGSLLDAGLSIDILRSELSKLKLDYYKISKKRVERGGIAATKFDVEMLVPSAKAGFRRKKRISLFRSPAQIISIIDKSDLAKEAKEISEKIITAIVEAEAQVHGKKMENIHFHEMGAVDLLVDVVGASIAFKELGITQAYCSPLVLGRGRSEGGGGVLPIPPPATLALLKNRRVSFSEIPFELTTPTGAAILKTVCEEVQTMPSMKISAVGYGAGARRLKEFPNLLRVVIGETDPVYPVRKGFAPLDSKYITQSETSPEFSNRVYKTDTIFVLETNIDDMNPLHYEPLWEKLYKRGALDVYITSIHMKKSRPGFLLTVLLEPHNLDNITSLLFDETPTFGLRYYQASRRKLDRRMRTVTTKYGKVRVKIGSADERVKTISPEYEDCKRVALEKKMPFRLIYEEVKKIASDL